MGTETTRTEVDMVLNVLIYVFVFDSTATIGGQIMVVLGALLTVKESWDWGREIASRVGNRIRTPSR